jgi:Transposase IS4
MPVVNRNLDVNVRISVTKRFISDNQALNMLGQKFDLNAPGLRFRGKTVARSNASNGREVYDVMLDDIPAITVKISAAGLKYEGPLEASGMPATGVPAPEPTEETSDAQDEDLLEDAMAEESEDEMDLTDIDPERWIDGSVEHDHRRTSGNGYHSLEAMFSLQDKFTKSTAEYFLYFLPLDFFISVVIPNINTHARSIKHGWTDVDFPEYLTWIALLMVMTLVKHVDRKAYWRMGSSHFMLQINFSEYMSLRRFEEIMAMHVFEIPDGQRYVYRRHTVYIALSILTRVLVENGSIPFTRSEECWTLSITILPQLCTLVLTL